MSTTSKEQIFVDGDVNESELVTTQRRYEQERRKRLRDSGNAQFIDISLSNQHDGFLEDPWADFEAVETVQAKFPVNRCQVLIIGAGWGGILNAVRMVDAGISPENIRIVDTAAGFGGTWYWHRYPGLMCDIESYSYLPLLEETLFVPKHRYSHGEEIRKYVNLVVQKWGLSNSGVFQSKAQNLVWDENAKEWQLDVVQQRQHEAPQTINIRSTFVVLASGVLHWPKLPDIPGFLSYQGKVFHSSRWAYHITGGSPSDPSLDLLKDKRVAIIGTGATSIQIAPHLARWSKHLYVVQRTPAAVDRRDQRETDEDWFRQEVARGKGWQRERIRNFHQHFTLGEQPATNLVDDEWTRAIGLLGLTGNADGPKSMDDVPAYIATVNEIDLPRQNRIRARVDEIVKDPATAASLKAWYPSWCKRPCFHDEYLETFNRDNVTLVDTDGKDIDSLTANSIVVGNKSYDVDLIIFATGYRSPFSGGPGEKANMTIVGRDGVLMSEEWAQHGPTTLHGVLDYKFPNLFLSGPAQASTSGNFVFNLDMLAKHSAYILTQAMLRANGKPFSVAPDPAAADHWGLQVLMHAAPMALSFGCTPSYFNMEGDIDRAPVEMRMKMARSGLWGSGIEDFLKVIESWRADGNMRGIQVQIQV
ncbi:hypothetical protein BGW36DRAFT_301315 [Talaromyces proteolyticus]|uniref:FAD/NAD(P)-binding domain-containing protein n=1 Tax=Talaromyces proteolyticus TaxID=1131652 RepID=A0AAD4PU41_9EURO|nr:uncharacterized protein BGW36DRAFT_301315 [Talaromyces proteolyticus]KAH8694178.1 hypothetical protein BGW36DRAFT_301315 [Talaromyces proteolyticus]